MGFSTVPRSAARSNPKGLRRPRLIALLLAIGVVFFARVGWSAGGTVPAEKARTMRPEAIYRNYCSVCHGDRGDGRSRARTSLVPPPRDFTQPSARTALTRDYMITVTREGKPGTAMVGWKRQLSEREIAGVIDYVRTTFMNPDLPKNLARGRDIYQTTCSVCHGDRGDGRSQAQRSLTPPPRDFTAAPVEVTRSHMIYTVNKGHSKTAMVSFSSQLSASDIEAVVDYIRSAFMADAGRSGSGTLAHGGKEHDATPHSHRDDAHDRVPQANMSRPFAKGLKGNPVRGAKFYVANCAACHGKKGDGNGPRAYFINPKPRNFLDASSRAAFSRPDLFSAIAMGRRGSEMPAWSKVLNDQQIADVAEYVFRQFIRSNSVLDIKAGRKE